MPTIAIIGDELALSWNDGVEQYLSLKRLRQACPCAVCCGEPELTGQKLKPSTVFKKESFLLKSYEFVGGYGLQFHWGDGHKTGIYSYGYIKILTPEP